MPASNRRALADVADITSAQLGLITAAQLAEIGFARNSTHHRTRHGGPWLRVLPGTYLVGERTLAPEQRRLAALLYVGAPSMLTGASALELHGITAAERWPADQVHVLIPEPRKRASRDWVTVERTKTFPDPTHVDGLPLVSPARAGLDACRRTESRFDVRALITEIVHDRHATIGELRDALRTGQRRRTALAREAIDLLALGPASVAEMELYERWEAAGLPVARWNVDLLLPDGTFLARPDVYLPEAGLVIELDSEAHHLSTPQWEATMQRRARMSAHGLDTIAVTPRRVRGDFARFAAEVRAAHRRREGRAVTGLRERRAIDAIDVTSAG